MPYYTLNQFSSPINDFFFTNLTNAKTRTAIVVCHPNHALCKTPLILHSSKTLDEHIAFIQSNKVREAVIVAENIEFLTQCPSLERLWIIPSDTGEEFDFSPLYQMPNIKWLRCETVYGPKWERKAFVDYSRIRGLEYVIVSGAVGHLNIEKVDSLKDIVFEQGYPLNKSLANEFDVTNLETLTICQSSIQSLDGLVGAPKIYCVRLAYNPKLIDISSLLTVKSTLTELEIENCSMLTDFSVLNKLDRLEKLVLIGSNTVDNIAFVRSMPRLKTLVLTVNVADGDLSACLGIPHVVIKNRKHYSHKNKDFRK